MQINNSVYVDIEIEKLNEKNFLGYGDLLDLQIVETAGTSLPIIYASFVSHDKKITEYIIKNNIIKVKLGKTEKEADTFTVQIYLTAPPTDDPSGTGKVVEFSGFVVNEEFMVAQKSKAYKGNSLLVAKQVIAEYMNGKGFLTNITKTNERQVVWRQNNQTACTFLAETLVHMDIMPNFPMFTFDKYGNFFLYDFNSLIERGPKWNFVPHAPSQTNDIQYYNNLNIESFKDSYNLYSGFNKVTEIYGASKGVPEYVVAANEPILAATKEAEKSYSGNRYSMNDIQSSNVHDTYAEAFAYNTNKLVALSSLSGALKLQNTYYKDLRPLDLVNVETGDTDKTNDGYYLVDTIRIQVDMSTGMLITYVYITRDNKNSVENFITNPQKGLSITKKWLSTILNSVSQMRTAYAQAKKIMDGTFLNQMMSFAIMTKNNLLRSFSVAGVAADFTSQANLLRSMINIGNSLMNSLVSMIFPEEISYIFRDFIIRKPSLKTLLTNYVITYVPFELRDIINTIIHSIFVTTDSLNSIARENGISSTVEQDRVGEEEVPITPETETQNKIDNIITDFENNTSGLSIPFPIIDLTESQALMPEPALRDYIAEETIKNLTDLGYMEDVDKEEFKDILLGEKPIDFNLIDKINSNAGGFMNYRFWGTYSDPTELTSFYIKKCYKDKYRTLPCTKFINATGNTRIFFACPNTEEDVKFYVNSKRLELDSFELNLGYNDAYGNPIIYNVYFTETGYNSNSVLFEVKQGGMV